jgi:hypothetical protein
MHSVKIAVVTHQERQHQHAVHSCPSSGACVYDRQGTEDRLSKSAIELLSHYRSCQRTIFHCNMGEFEPPALRLRDLRFSLSRLREMSLVDASE